ncbi:hypothetical protein PSQ19_06775 [Devosia algicola]|uniref:Magnesium transporter MgtE intracellular domain-containing protein n=1 Tax=Devosia algicola TaxID=3026418 RepID=A0ABY7YRI7_9HYPH|nr:hypothetical protein [Devosia algicola]WDR03748.1 hypothetical protein PSQ19_06775 [Devosia algicola]
MKSVRLLPVVICAITALLVFKTVSLVTTGSYVLGVATARAEEHGGGASETGGDAAIELPGEPTLQDDSPIMTDMSPTLAQIVGKKVTDGEHLQASADAPATSDGHSATAAESDNSSGHESPPTDGEPTPVANAAVSCAADGSTGEAGANGNGAAAEGAGGHAGTGGESAGFAEGMVSGDCDPYAEAIPMKYGPDGTLIPLTDANGGSLTERALLERLGERRIDLDKYAAELDMRQSLVDAAEKKIDERAATLKALEEQISKLVDQRKEMETGQFAGIITMYESMKPKDAAAIFDNLDMDVLLRVAKTMNPRKMAPVLAAMSSTRAQELTVRMAASADAPNDIMDKADLSALPQIVGQ